MKSFFGYCDNVCLSGPKLFGINVHKYSSVGEMLQVHI